MKWIKHIFLAISFFTFSLQGCGQSGAKMTGLVKNREFDEKIARTIRQTIPVIGVEELKNIQNEVVIFDARNREEFETSHIPGAEFLGYKNFDPEQLKSIGKDKKIVLYCSIGYRSEKIGEKLKGLGFTEVYNLYGSIFEWVNRGFPVVDPQENTTHKVHTYNYSWSKWINNEHIEKVW